MYTFKSLWAGCFSGLVIVCLSVSLAKFHWQPSYPPEEIFLSPASLTFTYSKIMTLPQIFSMPFLIFINSKAGTEQRGDNDHSSAWQQVKRNEHTMLSSILRSNSGTCQWAPRLTRKPSAPKGRMEVTAIGTDSKGLVSAPTDPTSMETSFKVIFLDNCVSSWLATCWFLEHGLLCWVMTEISQLLCVRYKYTIITTNIFQRPC